MSLQILTISPERKEWMARKSAEKKKLEELQKAESESAVAVPPEIGASLEVANMTEANPVTETPHPVTIQENKVT